MIQSQLVDERLLEYQCSVHPYWLCICVMGPRAARLAGGLTGSGLGWAFPSENDYLYHCSYHQLPLLWVVPHPLI